MVFFNLFDPKIFNFLKDFFNENILLKYVIFPIFRMDGFSETPALDPDIDAIVIQSSDASKKLEELEKTIKKQQQLYNKKSTANDKRVRVEHYLAQINQATESNKEILTQLHNDFTTELTEEEQKMPDKIKKYNWESKQGKKIKEEHALLAEKAEQKQNEQKEASKKLKKTEENRDKLRKDLEKAEAQYETDKEISDTIKKENKMIKDEIASIQTKLESVQKKDAAQLKKYRNSFEGNCQEIKTLWENYKKGSEDEKFTTELKMKEYLEKTKELPAQMDAINKDIEAKKEEVTKIVRSKKLFQNQICKAVNLFVQREEIKNKQALKKATEDAEAAVVKYQEEAKTAAAAIHQAALPTTVPGDLESSQENSSSSSSSSSSNSSSSISISNSNASEAIIVVEEQESTTATEKAIEKGLEERRHMQMSDTAITITTSNKPSLETSISGQDATPETQIVNDESEIAASNIQQYKSPFDEPPKTPASPPKPMSPSKTNKLGQLGQSSLSQPQDERKSSVLPPEHQDLLESALAESTFDSNTKRQFHSQFNSPLSTPKKIPVISPSRKLTPLMSIPISQTLSTSPLTPYQQQEPISAISTHISQYQHLHMPETFLHDITIPPPNHPLQSYPLQSYGASSIAPIFTPHASSNFANYPSSASFSASTTCLMSAAPTNFTNYQSPASFSASTTFPMSAAPNISTSFSNSVPMSAAPASSSAFSSSSSFASKSSTIASTFFTSLACVSSSSASSTKRSLNFASASTSTTQATYPITAYSTTTSTTTTTTTTTTTSSTTTNNHKFRRAPEKPTPSRSKKRQHSSSSSSSSEDTPNLFPTKPSSLGFPVSGPSTSRGSGGRFPGPRGPKFLGRGAPSRPSTTPRTQPNKTILRKTRKSVQFFLNYDNNKKTRVLKRLCLYCEHLARFNSNNNLDRHHRAGLCDEIKVFFKEECAGHLYWRCKLCNKEFEDFLEASTHILKNHENEEIICNLCSKKILLKELKGHKTLHLDEFDLVNIVCKKCQFSGTSYDFINHLIDVHKEILVSMTRHTFEKYMPETTVKLQLVNVMIMKEEMMSEH